MSQARKHHNDSHETRIALLEQSVGHISQTLLRIETKLDGVDASLNTRINVMENSLNTKINSLEHSLNTKMNSIEYSLNARIDKVDNRLWQIMFLLSSSIIGVILGKIFHWF